MFDIGWSELVVIAVVALIAIGPKELPGVLRMVGQWMGKARKMAAEFQGQFQEAMREAEMADLDCLPLADVPVAGADAVIGNRAYGTEPAKVAAIARAVTEGLEQGGVLPVLKHIPGHGRATADSHFRLPTVDTSREELERTDFAAFQPLADLPMAMTAHVVFSALDPAQPATTSATIIRQVIRGVIGFQGLLMSDDVSMNALAGSIAERDRAIVNAGCDMVLHCNGKLDEMHDVARETPELAGEP